MAEVNKYDPEKTARDFSAEGDNGTAVVHALLSIVSEMERLRESVDELTESVNHAGFYIEKVSERVGE